MNDTVMTDQPALQAQTPQSQVSVSTPGGGEPAPASGAGAGGGAAAAAAAAASTRTTLPFGAPPTPGSTGWHTSKFQQEYDLTKTKLQGKFDIRDYPDPLLPRGPPQLPKSITPERAQQLRDLKAKIEAQRPRA